MKATVKMNPARASCMQNIVAEPRLENQPNLENVKGNAKVGHIKSWSRNHVGR